MYLPGQKKGNVIVLKSNGAKLNPGKGSIPVLQAIDNERLVCVWENEIHTAVIEL